MWINYNPNPVARMVDDCAVRAISKALDVDWEQAHILLDINSINMGDMPNANSVWGLSDVGAHCRLESDDSPNF